MANTSAVCRSCLIALRHQARASPLEARSPISRTTIAASITPRSPFSRTTRTYASGAGLPEPALAQTQPGAAPGVAVAGGKIRGLPGDIGETYIARGATEALFKECARQADYVVPEAFEGDKEVPKNDAGEDIGQGTGWWYEELGLPPGFAAWSQVTMLHMYLLTVRLRYFPQQYSTLWLQHLHDHFFYEAEHRMTIFHGISARGVRNKYLKDLYDQWRGVTAAYDEGLIRGDAVLAAAVWRNVFKAREDVDWSKVALVVSFMRRGLRALDKAQDRQIVGGLVRFASPATEGQMVAAESEWMKKPFGPEDDEALQGYLKELESTKKK